MTAKENPSPIVHDAPVRSRESAEFWGSDVFAAMLRELDMPYISLNPGASYRGLHDSIVNYLGNRTPQMLLSIHGRRLAASHGPVAPRISTGARSHQASNTDIVACIRPTLECSAAAIMRSDAFQ